MKSNEIMNVLYLGPTDTVEHIRAELGGRFDIFHALDEVHVETKLPDCHVVLDAHMRIRFDAKRLTKANKLQLFVTATTGADHIDDEILSGRGIPLLTLRDHPEVIQDITAASEHSWLLLLLCARRLLHAASDVSDGIWDRNRCPGIMIRGKTLGIIGCGSIGVRCESRSRSYGVHHSPHPGSVGHQIFSIGTW